MLKKYKTLIAVLLVLLVGILMLVDASEPDPIVRKQIGEAFGTTCIATAIVTFCFDLLIRREVKELQQSAIAEAITDPEGLLGSLRPEAAQRIVRAVLDEKRLVQTDQAILDPFVQRALELALGGNAGIAPHLLEVVRSHYSGAKKFNCRYKTKVTIKDDPDLPDGCVIISKIEYLAAAPLPTHGVGSEHRLRVAHCESLGVYESLTTADDFDLVLCSTADHKVEVEECLIGDVVATAQAPAPQAPYDGVMCHSFTALAPGGGKLQLDTPTHVVWRLKHSYRNRPPTLTYEITEIFQGLEVLVASDHPAVDRVTLQPLAVCVGVPPKTETLSKNVWVVSSDELILPRSSVVVAIHWLPRAPTLDLNRAVENAPAFN